MTMYKPLSWLTPCNVTGVLAGVAMCTFFATKAIYGDSISWGLCLVPSLISFIFGEWIMYDISAMQIDLSVDEYILGALDIWLDILNMFLYTIICCFYCA